MRFTRYFLAATLVTAGPAIAHADDIFTLTNGPTTITFTLPRGSVPSSGSTFYVNTDINFPSGGPQAETVNFYDSDSLGGFSIMSGPDVPGFNGTVFLNETGSTLFDGSAFLDGTYALEGLGDATYGGNYSLTIASAPVAETPEPGTFALLGTGVLVAVLVAGRKPFSA